MVSQFHDIWGACFHLKDHVSIRGAQINKTILQYIPSNYTVNDLVTGLKSSGIHRC